MAFAAKPNKTNLKNRSDYGVRVARPGYDANNCAQNQLLFNSGWPILQITEVIKLDDLVEDSFYNVRIVISWRDTQDPYSPGHYGTLSDTTTEEGEPPAGYTRTETYTEPEPSILDGLMVNKKYVRRFLGGQVTSYIYPLDTWTEGNIEYTKRTTCVKRRAGKKQHRLGYTPFFAASGNISNTDGYIVLFSVDIAEDVDYPYTEKPLAILGGTRDYGIKSSSIFGSKVPGLCTDMFSKLVQAVKTEKTSETGGGDARAVWSPVKTASEAEDGCLLPYEFYSFLGQSASNTGIDGGCYYRREVPFYVNKSEGATLDDAWAVSVTSYQLPITNKNSLVVLRSPMVSPEYEERTLS